MKRVVIVGGGYAGIEAGLTLHRRLKRKESIAITLINQNPFHTLLTELHEVAGGRVDADAVMVPLEHIFQYTRVKVVQDVVTELDLAEKKVHSKDREYPYDYLILALGSQPAFYGIEGMEANCLPLWSLEDALRIRRHVRWVVAKAAQSGDPLEKQSYLTLVVGGGGFTGIEMMGELIRWKRHLAREFQIRQSEIRLILVEAMNRILPTLEESLAQRVADYLDRNNVQVITGHPIRKVEEDKVYLDGGLIIPTRTLIWTGGVVANQQVQASGLPRDKRGRVLVNDYLQVEGFPEVYAVGDNSGLQWEEDGTCVHMPALVESALQTGKTAALNIIAEVQGKRLRIARPKYHGLMVSVGRWWGVAEVMGLPLVGVLSVLMKHLVNIHYLFGIAGFEQVFRYLHHEFFSLPVSCQNGIERQFTRQRPLFFLVPLRLYLGYMWLMEGLKKVSDGWWNRIALGKAVLAASEVTSIPAVPVDVESGATLMQLVSPHTPWWYAWFVERFVYPHALLFQRFIIIVEIGLGLAFLFGFMTVIAAFVSLGLNINFLLPTGLYDYWYIFASVAMFAGAGSVFGLDYVVMPYLMRQWRYFVRNKRLHPFLLR